MYMWVTYRPQRHVGGRAAGVQLHARGLAEMGWAGLAGCTLAILFGEQVIIIVSVLISSILFYFLIARALLSWRARGVWAGYAGKLRYIPYI
jgi:hypothetical protein